MNNNNKKNIYIMGIETSCDETSVAILKDGREVLSNIISSQIDIHKLFGGVVPEIASRKHVEIIDVVTEQALQEANLNFSDLTAIAVTYAPGLVGALLVGFTYAKALAYALKIPLIPVHHIEAHICANLIEHKDLKPPFLSLVISGGHTHIAYVKDYTKFEILGKTRDDACGEAFDKVARTLGLPYPGGPQIDNLAKKGDETAINLPRVMIDSDDYDFSFSGLKSAVLNFVNKCNMSNIEFKKEDLSASFQKALTDVLVKKTIRACKEQNLNILTLAGGVSANSYIRSTMQKACQEENITLYYPTLELCTDNGAMIACSGYFEYLNKNFGSLDLNVYPNLKLGQTPPKGYIQVYTGDGKGKTTAILGLALRAIGANKSIFIGQFLKDDKYGVYSEVKAINNYLPSSNIRLEQFGSGDGFVDKNNLKEADISSAQKGYMRVLEVLESNKYDIVILDEINVAVYMKLLLEEDILNIIKAKSLKTELVLTGRYALDKVIEKADLVTEMKEVKHYYNNGVEARIGIEK